MARQSPQELSPADAAELARPSPAGAKASYLEALLLIERLHRRFLDVIKLELERVGVKDVNNVQALILYNIGDGEMTVGELTSRGYYLGSNVSYNLKKLVENGYLVQERSSFDRRSVRVRLSTKELGLYGQIDDLYERHVAAIDAFEARGDNGIAAAELAALIEALHNLERFWTDQVRFNNR